MLLVFFSILLRQKQRKKQKVYTIIHIQYIWKSNVFFRVLSLDIEMLDWNMVKTKTLSWKKKWKACSLSLKEMFRICNLAVKHIFFHCCRMIQMQKITNGHAQWEYWPLENFKFLYFKEMTAEPQQNRKTASLKSFVSAGIHADEESILHTWKYDAVLY